MHTIPSCRYATLHSNSPIAGTRHCYQLFPVGNIAIYIFFGDRILIFFILKYIPVDESPRVKIVEDWEPHWNEESYQKPKLNPFVLGPTAKIPIARVPSQ